MRWAWLAPCFGCVATASACLWDSDTLKQEAANKMDLVRVITGRFERWPALYYEVRLERVKRELADPSTVGVKRLELFDDAAVALDRLHRDDEAIDLIEQKRQLLAKLDPTIAKQKDHWYRYYANCGTFWVHRWFATGADHKRINEVVRARDLIAKALRINPDAHFGRETYQLYALEWIIDPRRPHRDDQYREVPPPKGTPINRDTSYSLGDFIEHRANSLNFRREPHQHASKGEVGLAGLISLGAAWESIDIFEALATVSDQDGDSAISTLAAERVKELWDQGKRSLIADARLKDLMPSNRNLNASDVVKDYPRLRNNADQWGREREQFAMQRLREGRHPDTDPSFWEGYQELPLVELTEPSIGARLNNWMVAGNGSLVVGGTCCFLPVGAGFGLWYALRRRRRRPPKLM